MGRKKSKIATNGQSIFDLTEATKTMEGGIETRLGGEEWLKTREKTKLTCAECAEEVVVGGIAHPLARGTMVKRGKIVKSWKKRFFVLAGKHLTYHTDQASVNAQSPLGVIHLMKFSVGEELGESLKKAEKKHVDKGFAWYLQTDERKWVFVCEDAVERERWIANVVAAGRRPFARFCAGCQAFATVPDRSAYVESAHHTVLTGPRRGEKVFLVVAKGHVLMYASAAQHNIDRTRVLAGGVLHLKGAVVQPLRRGVWQAQTPDDGRVHQFELEQLPDISLEDLFDRWLRALRQEQHIPKGEDPPTSISGPVADPEDVDVAQLRHQLYNANSPPIERPSYRGAPKAPLAGRRAELAKSGASPKSRAATNALSASMGHGYGDSSSTGSSDFEFDDGGEGHVSMSDEDDVRDDVAPAATSKKSKKSGTRAKGQRPTSPRSPRSPTSPRSPHGRRKKSHSRSSLRRTKSSDGNGTDMDAKGRLAARSMAQSAQQ